MSQIPPAKAPTGPKVSGTRTIVSLVFLGIVLVVCVIEVRAGLGQYLTLRSFNKVSENNQFKNIPFAEAHGMVAAFPSKADVQTGHFEDIHHYYWYSLLRPLTGKKSPEIFVWADHSNPPTALSFSTSIEDETFHSPVDPNASPPMTTMPPGGPGGMGMGMGMGMGGPPGGGQNGAKGNRPPLEDEATDSETKEPAATDRPATEDESEAAPTEPAPTEPAPTEPAPTEPNATPEPAAENPKSETPAAPN